ncbi:hypothetical protein KC946_01155 [Candidatus Saccharibacteria bacterium]|nr:hypothetical protein [Candidatus Saccharibacteria bacterium]
MKAIAGITSILLLAIMFVTNSSSVTAATNYNVTPISSCTLPDAIIAANTNAIQGSCPAGTVGLDTITMAAGTYALTANLPIITEDLHIIGASVDTTLIDGDDTYSGLIVKDSNGSINIELDKLTIQNTFGDSVGDESAGLSVIAEDSIINLDNVRITGNRFDDSLSTFGFAGIFYNVTQNIDVTITNSEISNNQAIVAGISNNVENENTAANLVLTNVNINNNFSIGGNGASGCLLKQTNGDMMFNNLKLFENTVDLDSPQGLGTCLIANSDPEGIIDIQNSSFYDNDSGPGSFGGLWLGFFSPNLTTSSEIKVRSSSFYRNSGANFSGLNISHRGDSPVSLKNITSSNNSPSPSGLFGLLVGGVAINSDQVQADNFTLSNMTIADNVGIGIAAFGEEAKPVIHISNTILDNNVMPDVGALNCLNFYDEEEGEQVDFSPLSLGGNISSDASCGNDFTKSTDINSKDPKLGDLADNGGYSLTRALTATSPAINAGVNVNAPNIDQRGISRPQGSKFDSGAYEFVEDDDVVELTEENGAPNQGDGNNDGIKDYLQSNVTSFKTKKGSYITAACSACTTISKVKSFLQEEIPVIDNDFSYPLGMVDFTLDTGVGEIVDIELYFYTAGDAEEFVGRKFITNNSTFSDLPNATLQKINNAGSNAIKLSYSIQDGGNLDDDGVANGKIVDPVGLGLANELAKTGQGISQELNIAVTLLVVSVLFFIARKTSLIRQ